MRHDAVVINPIVQLQGLMPGSKVLLANPVADSVLAAITDAGARYVDAGRRHDFSIDAGAWRAALSHTSFAMVYLSSPNSPTATVPAPERAEEASATGVAVCWDSRFLEPAVPSALRRLLEDQGVEVVAGTGASLWVRIAGIQSAEIAAAAARSEVTGRVDWTWRDCVRVQAKNPTDFPAIVAALASVRSRC